MSMRKGDFQGEEAEGRENGVREKRKFFKL
jgi:hypothetical protein